MNKRDVVEQKKIWVVSEVFYPEEVSTAYIMTIIAEELAVDNDVNVICGPIGYDHITGNFNRHLNVKVHRVPTFNFSKNNIIGRLIRLVMLSIGMFFKGILNIKKTDTVFTVTNPAFIIPFYALIKKIRKNRLIVLVHDVFPENLVTSKIIKSTNTLFYRGIKQAFNWSYKQADVLIVLGADMLEVMGNKIGDNQRIRVIENWADTVNIQPALFAENQLVQSYNLHDKIVFTFAGNIGRLQGLEFLFSVIKQVTNPRVHFLFVGNGAMLGTLKAEVEKTQIKCVTFIESMPRSEQHVFLNAAHYGLVTLTSDLYGLGVPSKSYNIMAAGKPILFIGNKQTEIGKMVVEQQCGLAFDEMEKDKLIRFFNDIGQDDLYLAGQMGKKARLLAATKYSRNFIVNKFKEVIN